jgi:predicted RNA-binding Zn-ribbon protein involved in translation (DUF1610 family)
MDREQAIKILERHSEHIVSGSLLEQALSMAIKELKAQLSQEGTTSKQPEPKEGHWILNETPDGGEQYECSECGVLWEFNDGTPEDNEAYYCPKCGTKMIGEQDGH